MISSWLLFLLTFFLGYILGQQEKPIKQQLTEKFEAAKEKAQAAIEEPFEPGPVLRPSAKEIFLRNQPQKVREGKEAMKEDLDKIPDLVKARDYVRSQRI